MKTEDKVYSLLTKIPKGKATTYGAIAKTLNINPRLVGGILSRNRHPDKYPCYKVIRSDRSLGGYTVNGKNNEKTLKIKVRKLKADGVKIDESGRVDKRCIFYG